MPLVMGTTTPSSESLYPSAKQVVALGQSCP